MNSSVISGSPERYSKPFQASKMELLEKIVHGWKPLITFEKKPNLDVCQVFNTPLSILHKN